MSLHDGYWLGETTVNEFAMRRTWGPAPRYPLVEAYDPSFNKPFVVISGPCSVESHDQIAELAVKVKSLGATHLRGGVFRAGTYPGKKFGYVDTTLISAYHRAAEASGLKNIIEILDYTPGLMFDFVLDHADCVQVGARQMQNYTLLRTLGKTNKPVFLKRHPGATLDEWLGAAEHILTAGSTELYLTERGSSTNANHVRWDLSISMIPAIKAITKIPVICDASHGTGRRDLVEPMALAGVAAGAGGILVEVHNDPANSLSDPDQAISPNDFEILMMKVNKIREVL